jgi:hypothetical protein
MLLMVQIFKVSERSSLRIGYNSMGADCITNNLHFHIVYADHLFGHHFSNLMQRDDYAGQAEMFPIELAEKRLFFRSTLQHKNKEEINMYNCAVRFGQLENWPVKTLILSPDIDDSGEEVSLEDA